MKIPTNVLAARIAKMDPWQATAALMVSSAAGGAVILGLSLTVHSLSDGSGTGEVALVACLIACCIILGRVGAALGSHVIGLAARTTGPAAPEKREPQP